LKITKLANKLLLWFVKEFKDTNKQFYDFENIRHAFPDHSEESLIQAIYLLKNNGFVNTLDADDIPYITTVLPDAIRQVEENTLLKKGYNFVKKITDLIP
jgi:hypothetical protein